MKKIIVSIVILIESIGINAQAYDWAKNIGGSEFEYSFSITTDQNGNVYTTGYFEGTVDFDPGPGTSNITSAGITDIFISKLDANGNFVWAKSMEGNDYDRGLSISIDQNGNIYTSGAFKETVDFDPSTSISNLTSNGSHDIFISKLNTNGDFVWAKSIGGSDWDECLSISIDQNGNIYITGAFQGTVDFDPSASTSNLTSNGDYDIFISKFDTNGNFMWAKNIGGSSSDFGVSISIDQNGMVYSTGAFFGTVDFDPSFSTSNLTSNGFWDIFILKLDANGNFLWANNMGGSAWDQGQSITTDQNGNIYTTGFFEETLFFDSTSMLTSNGGRDIFISKFDTNGNFVWANNIGGSDFDSGNSISIDQNGNVYTTGEFQGIVDFDPSISTSNLTSNGWIDIFILKYDTNGSLVWAKNIGGSGSDKGQSISVDQNGNIYTAGNFGGTVDFNPSVSTSSLTSNGNLDFFILKLNPCSPNTGTDTQSACNTYTWIDGNIYTTSNNTATYTLTNITGCDSVVTLDLTINTIDISLTITDPTILSNAVGANYQWLDCNNNFTSITGETNPPFTPTSNGSYAVKITQNSCTDTSTCITISSVGLIEYIGYNNPIELYPNPSSGGYRLVLGTLQNVSINIFNTDGKLVYAATNISTEVYQFELNLENGIYCIVVISNEEKYQLKLIKG